MNTSFVRSPHFCSIQDFQNYFQAHDELKVSANESFIIHHVSIFDEDIDRYQQTDQSSQKAHEFILNLLNKIVHPLAKTIRICQEESRETDWSIGEDFQINCTVPITITAEKGTIYTRMQDLFKMMIYSSLLQIEFAPQQELVILDIEEGEEKIDHSIKKSISEIAKARTPVGFDSCWDFYKGEVNVMRLCTNQGNSNRGSLKICPIKGMKISLIANHVFSSLEDFVERMSLTNKIKVKSGESLVILDHRLSALWYEYSRCFNDRLKAFMYVFNQMFLHLGKEVKFIGSSSGAYGFIEGGRLEISSQGEFNLTLESGRVLTSLNNLAQAMLNYQVPALLLQPDQPLVIYDFEDNEVSGWVSSSNLHDLQLGLCGFFTKRCIDGYIWRLEAQNLNCKIAFIDQSSQASPVKVLEIYSTSEMKLLLDNC